ncbi:FtsW/RodA/SpoVE family cell cycle protein [Candidatus Leptofilum sp.]|uniref:FtsW/RodA/SpoVE family cell cycle protein n=1 Tax=Candidatus Leptofilum sp. TaxID=3241576 RepID=UPI003B59033E
MTTVNIVRKRTVRVNPVLRFRFDYWLLLSIAGMLVLGMLMVYSTTFDYGLRFQDDATYYFRRQFMALGLGFVAIVGVMQFDYHILRRFSVPFLGLTLAGLLFVLFFTAVSDLGAQRGLYNDSYQPSEIAKLAMIIYIAHWLSSKGDRIKMLTYGLLPFSVIVGVVSALIVRQPDLSTAGLIALVSFTLFFVAGADWRQFALAGLLGGSVFLVLINTLPHAQARVDAYTQALSDPAQASWHVQQSLIALGRGGIFGVGLGESTQKFGPLPFAHTDGVFAILGEELGLAGTLLVIVLLGMFVWRGLRTAVRARDSFGSLLALGITCWIVFQAFINIAVITAVIPFTGIPLPFLSYGGTSLAITMVGAGILLNISRDLALQKRPQGNGGTRRKSKRNTRRSRRPSATDRF